MKTRETAGSDTGSGGIARPGPRTAVMLERVFRFLLARRWWILTFYAAVLPLSTFFALRVRQDNSLDRLVVAGDPDAVNAREFEKVFGSGEYIVLLAEAPDPFTPDVLRLVDEIERRLERLPGVEPSSALSVFRRSRSGFDASPEQSEAFRRFVAGTTIFREQRLVGDGFLAVPVVLHSSDPEELKGMLRSVDRAIDEASHAAMVTIEAGGDTHPAAGGDTHPAEAAGATVFAETPRGPPRTVETAGPAGEASEGTVPGRRGPLTALRKIGGPYVNAYLDEDTARSSRRYFPIFGAFVLGLNLLLYRSLRTLLAFIVTMAVSVALTVGYIGATGGVLTIVSPLVPMTILVTCTATLVYLHSRFVDRPAGSTVEEHQVFSLVNKFTACTASIIATAAGFAALTVSRIPPIRDMGIWVAVGMLFTWLAVFTLFPALQRVLRTPTHAERKTAGGAWLAGVTQWLPSFSYHWRWALVSGALLLCLLGGVSLAGLPGLLPPMKLETDGIEYVNHDSALYKDTKRFEKIIAGLSVTEVWLRGEPAALTDPLVLRGIDRFQEMLKREPGIGSVAGPTTILRMLRYLGGEKDDFPEDPAEVQKLASDLELLLPTEPTLRGFVDGSLSQTHIAVISRAVDFEAFQRLRARIEELWREAAAGEPALAGMELRTAGSGPLQAKIAHHLVPTLVESFVLTVVIIFVAFLIVFRNGPARLMAMIPSLFAILVMFAVMRITGMTLNVATILIASTVLGTSENDQIHFFYHFLERRRSGTVEQSLQHTLRIAGKAIFYATMINAGGFLAFAFADLPPMRQFGILTAIAFLLSMIADFTALPAALWIIHGERPRAAEPTPS